jgi:hypothetical protein
MVSISRVSFFYIAACTVVVVLTSNTGCMNAQVADSVNGSDPILGEWKYQACTIKNSSMTGTLRFYADGRMVLHARARDDCPVPEVSGTYAYRIQGNRLISEYNSYGVCEFFLVESDMLYFSWREFSKAEEEWLGGRLVANWQYSLKRVR